MGSQVSRSCATRIAWSGPAVIDLVDVGAEGQHLVPLVPGPAQLDRDPGGESSTSMRPRSAGVSSQNEPSASRFSTPENRQTISLRLIGVPRYSQVPSRLIEEGQVTALDAVAGHGLCGRAIGARAARIADRYEAWLRSQRVPNLRHCFRYAGI